MKPNYIFSICFTVLIMTSSESYSQCNPTIDNFTILVDSDDFIPSGTHQDSYWVCPDLNFGLSIMAHSIYAEANDSIFIYMDAVNIYIKGPGFIRLSGNDNLIVHEASVVIDDLGTGNSFTPCSTITYNYSQAPFPGCFTPAGTSGQLSESDNFIFFPNPARNELFLSNLDNSKTYEVRVYSLTGNLTNVFQINPGQATLDISKLNSGLYTFLTSEIGGETSSQRIMIE